MSSNNSHQADFDILKVVELARTKKYEITSAGFAALDKIDKINFPKKMKTRKPAVQALFALTENLVKFDYFSIDEKKKLLQEAGLSDAPYTKGFKNLFPSSAPVAEEAEEEEIPEETAPVIEKLASDDDFDDDEGEFEDEEDSLEEDDEDV
ncbi:MAG: DNA primase [Leptospiraceae bacterium]|nr:DNA primase [Leptospiraceae bacterium]